MYLKVRFVGAGRPFRDMLGVAVRVVETAAMSVAVSLLVVVSLATVLQDVGRAVVQGKRTEAAKNARTVCKVEYIVIWCVPQSSVSAQQQHVQYIPNFRPDASEAFVHSIHVAFSL